MKKHDSEERFIKYIPSEEAMYLLIHKPNAFRLLTIIANLVRRYDGHPDGLKPGQCYIGDWKSYGMSEQNYRTAKSILEMRQHLKIVETCRTRKKSTTGVTTVGTLVELISLTVYDVNLIVDNDRPNDRPTTDQRPTNDELRKKKNVKKEKEQQPQTPSGSGTLSVVVSPSLKKIQDLNEQEKLELSKEFSEERISRAVKFFRIEGHRKAPIAGYRWHCREAIPPTPSSAKLPPHERIALNREIARAAAALCKKSSHCHFEIFNQSAEIVFVGAQKSPICYDFKTEDPEKMRQELEKNLKNVGLMDENRNEPIDP